MRYANSVMVIVSLACFGGSATAATTLLFEEVKLDTIYNKDQIQLHQLGHWLQPTDQACPSEEDKKSPRHAKQSWRDKMEHEATP